MTSVSDRRGGHHKRLPCLVGPLVALLIGAAHGTAAAQSAAEEAEEDGEYQTVVRGVKILPTDETTGLAETIDVSDGNSRMDSVSEVLSESVGVQVRRLGGLGSYGAASIRGSTSCQVPVYLDGILLNSGGVSSVNLGDLSLESLETIEVYRGSAPIRLGASGIGGAISLTTRDLGEPVTEASVSVGSWGSGRLVVLRGEKIGAVDALALITAQGARGDFTYLDRHGTPLNDEDDRFAARSNNQHVTYGALLKLDGSLGAWSWTLANDLSMKQQGIAGMENIPTESANLRSFRDGVHLEFGGSLTRFADLTLELDYLTMRQDFDDTDNEIGVGYQRTRSATDAVGAGALTEIGWRQGHETALRIDTRYEQFAAEELVADVVHGDKWRVDSTIGLGHDWTPLPVLKLSPSLRAQTYHSRFEGGPGPSGGEIEARSVDSLFWSPFFGLRWEMAPWLVFRTNAGRYVRAPDLAELFGNSGAAVGNPDLDPEVGINADAGLTATWSNLGALDHLRLEFAWFGSWVDDLIAYVQNSQNTIRPENIDAARILGAETSLRLRLVDLISLRGNYTFLHGLNLSDKPYHHNKRLPGRPAHEAYARVEVGRTFDDWGAAMWIDGDYAGSNYLDQANLQEDALARLFFGLGARIARPREGLTLTLEIKNLFDTIAVRDEADRLRPMRDFDGFPLPGRTFMATLHGRI